MRGILSAVGTWAEFVDGDVNRPRANRVGGSPCCMPGSTSCLSSPEIASTKTDNLIKNRRDFRLRIEYSTGSRTVGPVLAGGRAVPSFSVTSLYQTSCEAPRPRYPRALATPYFPRLPQGFSTTSHPCCTRRGAERCEIWDPLSPLSDTLVAGALAMHSARCWLANPSFVLPPTASTSVYRHQGWRNPSIHPKE